MFTTTAPAPAGTCCAKSPSDKALQLLRQWIENGALAAGVRLPSEQSLARRIGVSRTTVRGALEQLEQDGLLVPGGRGRTVASDVRGQSQPRALASAVALLAKNPSYTPASHQTKSTGFSMHIQGGVMEAINQAGLHGMALQLERVLQEGLGHLVGQGIRGIIAMCDAATDPRLSETMAYLRQEGVPVIVQADGLDLPEYDTVVSDHVSGSGELTRALIRGGRRRVARFWMRDIDTPYFGWLRQRDEGYEAACREAGVEPLPAVEAIVPALPPISPEVFEIKAKLFAGHLAALFAAHPDVDALLCMSDGGVFPVHAALRLLGREPGRDVVVAGYDNYWQDCPERQWESTPPFMTVDKRNVEIGQTLVDVLEERLANVLQPDPIRRVIAPALLEIATASS